jgi:YebC/PmpR family DNA-binding regulatory protein
MSGHSKWATIKRQKGANDTKRGQLFTKLSKAITIAVQQGGGSPDPESNFKLRLAVEAARGANMPKENIERAIQRASGKDAKNLAEAVYEGFGPGGFSVIVETLTDNKQRTVSEVKNVFDKNGGSMGSQGSVQYQFEKKGLIIVQRDNHTIDDLFLIAVDCQADDVEDNGEEVAIFTQPDLLIQVSNELKEKEITVISAELTWRPIVLFPILEIAIAQKAFAFLEKLENLDDVQKVYSNIDIAEEIMKDLS